MDRLDAFTHELREEFQSLHHEHDEMEVGHTTPTAKLADQVALLLDLELQQPITVRNVRCLIGEAEMKLAA